MTRLVWFAVSGLVGFTIDAGLTQLLLVTSSIGPLTARIPAIMTAMTATWFLNRTFTFGRSTSSLASEGLRYWIVGISAALVNYVIYSMLIAGIPGLQPTAAIVFSSLAAMAYSFLGYSRIVFRR